MTLTFSELSTEELSIDLGGVLPERFAGESVDRVRRASCMRGNQTIELGELFRIQGDPRSLKWRFECDVGCIHSLGAGMRSGSIEVAGHVGRRAGARMQGGDFHIQGNAGDWLGAEMTGGRIRVHGSVGRCAGAAFRGSRRGINGGEILVHGSAGDELGAKMRRGLIAVAGSVGEWLGARMLAGTIVAMSRCGARPGAGMRRGTIGLLGSDPPALLPTFRYACRARLPFLPIVARVLARRGFDACDTMNQTVDVFHGDFLTLGRGEILLGGK